MLVVLLLVTLGTATGGKWCKVGPGAAKRSEVTAFTCVPTHCLTINLTTYMYFSCYFTHVVIGSAVQCYDWTNNIILLQLFNPCPSQGEPLIV